MQVDIASYGNWAVDLVNTWGAHSEEPEYLPDTAAAEQWLSDDLGINLGSDGVVMDQDLETLRSARTALREVFDAEDPPIAAARLNALLERFPVHPVISDHDTTEWHLHLGVDQRAVGDAVVAAACFGLSALLTQVGFDRRGSCSADQCIDAYVDTSRNHSRKYCSVTCSNRANVAAHRARQRVH